MRKISVRSDKTPASATAHYSPALRVGDTLYCSGQVARDCEGNVVGKGDAKAQAAQAFENLKDLLEAADGSFADVVKLVIYVTNREYRSSVAEVRRQYLSGVGEPPAITLVVVSGLSDPDLLLEIDATAVLGGDQ